VKQYFKWKLQGAMEAGEAAGNSGGVLFEVVERYLRILADSMT
jgi:hypothetical protein